MELASRAAWLGAASQIARFRVQLGPAARGLLVILILETLLFTWTFPNFFGSDSVFFFARRLETPADLLNVFSGPDDRGHYRPLTLTLFSFVLYPVLGLEPRPYHLVPLLFHLANTVLAYLLFRRLLTGNVAILAATFYFGLNTNNFYPTYSITFMPDFMYAFFYLASLLAFLRFDTTRRYRWLAGGLVSFVLALLSKEASVTLPAILALCLWVVRRREHPAERSWNRPRPGTMVVATAVAAFYLFFLLSAKGGSLYPRDAGDPYRASFTLSTLAGKASYGWWALNLPSGTGQIKGHPRVMRALATVVPQALLPWAGEISNLWVRPTRLLRVLLIIPLLFVLQSGIRKLWRRDPMILVGAAWLAVTLAPVLFLAVKTMRHNLYLPLVGMAAVVGVSVAEARNVLARASRRRAALALAGLSATFLGAGALGVHNQLVYSWPVRASVVAQNSLADLRRIQPNPAPQSTLFFVDNGEEDIYFYFEGGNLFRIFHNGTLRTLFEGRGDKPPSGNLRGARVSILAYYDTHLYDVTDHYRAQSTSLLSRLTPENVSFDGHTQYALKDYFGTPGNRPAFLYWVARDGQCRRALVTLAGARVRFSLGHISERSHLKISAAMVHDLGDGANGRILLEHGGAKDLLYTLSLDPAHNPTHRKWFDSKVDLSQVAGEPATLVFECDHGKAGDSGADWFAWGDVRIIER